MNFFYPMATFYFMAISILYPFVGSTESTRRNINNNSTNHGIEVQTFAQQLKNPSIQSRRFLNSGGQVIGVPFQADRDNKLMSLLAARRTALISNNGNNPQIRRRPFRGPIQTPPHITPSNQLDCLKNCSNNYTSRTSAECIQYCSPMKRKYFYSSEERPMVTLGLQSTIIPNNNNPSLHDNNITLNNQSVKLYDINTIRDELLDMDESSHVVVINSKNNNEKFTTNMQSIKDVGNRNNIYEAEDLRTEFKLLPSSISTTSAMPHDRNTLKYTNIMRSKRLEALQSHQNMQQKVTMTSEKSTEGVDLAPYYYFGQKISTMRNADTRNQVIGSRRNPSLPEFKDNMREEFIQTTIRPNTTENHKFWISRGPNNGFQNNRNINIVAFNNAQRRAQSTIVTTNIKPITITSLPTITSSSAVPTSTTLISTSTETTTQSPAPTLQSVTISDITTDDQNTTKRILPVEINHDLGMSIVKQPTFTSNFNFSEITNYSMISSNLPEATTPTEKKTSPIIKVSKLQNNYNQWIPVTTSPKDENDQFFTVNDTEDERIIVVIEKSKSNEMAITSTTNSPFSKDQERITYRPIPDLDHLFPNLSSITSATVDTHTTTQNPSSVKTSHQITTTTEKMISNITTEISIHSTSLPKTSITFKIKPSTTNTGMNDSNKSINQIFNISSFFPISTLSITSTMNSSNSSQPNTPMSTENLIKPNITFNSKIKTLSTHEIDIEIHRMNMATYVLAALGMFPVILIILYVIKIFLVKKYSKVTDDLERYMQEGQLISPVVRLDQSDSSSIVDESIVTDRDFNRNKLRFKSILGEGNFGQVWKAEVDDLTGHRGTTRIVAVKTERAGIRQSGLKQEADIMRKLGSHPNVVTLLVACINQEPHLLIMEFAMRGRLLSLLRAARSTVTSLTGGGPNGRTINIINPLAPRQLASFIHDIACGMEYIAEKQIVHRDLAARNILLDHNGICKICDFGMSIDLEMPKNINCQISNTDFLRQESPESKMKMFEKSRNDTIGRSVRPALPIRWMAPEALQYHIFSIETDVWAFGIVMWEIITLGCTPYPNLSGREVVRNVPHGTRPDVPPSCRTEFSDLMQKAWRKDPRHRPSFTDARIELCEFLRLWEDDQDMTSEYLDVSGFSEDVEHGMVYLNRRISEFECEI